MLYKETIEVCSAYHTEPLTDKVRNQMVHILTTMF